MKQGNVLVSQSRYLGAAFAIALTLICPVWLSHAQQKRPAPPPPKPAPQANPFGSFGEELKQKAAETTISTLLNNDLPLKLDANAVYPIVKVLPGGPFHSKHLQLIAEDMDKPLPPGDYTINTLAFCTEYSVHRPGAGVAYVLGPLQGKAAGAIGDLLWRGTFQKNLLPQQLQAVSWAIQSGLRYSQMPKTYQSVVDNVIPDHKNELNGDFFQNIEDSYTNLAKGTKLPPLQQMLGGLGKSGQLALSADRQRQALLRQNASDQIKEQTLFAGQDQGVYTPVRAEEGPWTERIPGRVYMRLQIFGGNMAANNVMEIRVLPAALTTARAIYRPQLRFVNFTAPAFARPQPADLTSTLTSIKDMFQNIIGYALGAGAQALAQLPVQTQPPCTTMYVSPDDPFNPWRPPPCPGSTAPPVKSATPPTTAPPATASCDLPCAGHVQQVQGQVQVQRGNNLITLKPGDQINMNDRIITGPNSRTEADFADGTQMILAGKTSLVVDSYAYDPTNPDTHPSIFYRWLEGAFQWTSGKLGPPKSNERIETSHGTIGIRGTEFVAIMNSTGDVTEIDLIDGQLDITPKVAKRETLFTAPVKIAVTATSATGAPLSQAEYEAAKGHLSPSQGSGVPTL